MHTGQPLERIEADIDRDRFMTASEARTYRIVDDGFTTRKLRPVERTTAAVG